jgi:hypothetical protein
MSWRRRTGVRRRPTPAIRRAGSTGNRASCRRPRRPRLGDGPFRRARARCPTIRCRTRRARRDRRPVPGWSSSSRHSPRSSWSDGWSFQPRADRGRATELEHAGRQRPVTEHVDTSEPRACARAVLVGHRQRDERQEPQGFLQVDLQDDLFASGDRMDLDAAEQAKRIELSAIVDERGVMEGGALT